MKIIRYLTDSNEIRYGVQDESGVREIDGDLFGDFSVTERRAKVLKLLAPIVPASILCIGLNYRRHAEETGAKIPEYPVLFMKNIASLQNPEDPIELPRFLRSDEVDYEGELAVIIGKRCKNVSRDEALEYVLGYTCGNDVSARDWQRRKGGGQYCRGKSFDTFCPLGPVLVTADEIPNPNELQIRTVLNGETVQEGNTADMIFDVPKLIEFLSGSMTLFPGTVILTGTPHGVGMAAEPPRWLKERDEVEIEIEKIGTLKNPIIAEQI